MTCPVCGTVSVPGARFCHHCGAALPAGASPPAAERRVVTVLFGDLSDFTAWSEQHDPERVGAVTDRVLAALAEAVTTYGGHVDKLTGDGIMAVFGAPVAHEDDAERAVRAALVMQQAVRRVLDDERGGGAPLGLRVGLNTGEVAAGIQAALEYTVIGDTVNTAARLADVAATGAVYAGEQTTARTRHIASWRRLRPLRLKGKREPVDTYELLGLLDAPGTRSGLGDEAPFVGRETELARAASRLAEVVDRGEPRVMIYTGEAGLGKSRFATEVQRLVAGYGLGSPGYDLNQVRFDRHPAHFDPGAGTRILAVRCAAYGEQRRLAPLVDLVRIAIGLPAEPGPPPARPAIEERLRRVAHRLARLGPAAPPVPIEPLLALLGYGESGGAPERRPWLPIHDHPDRDNGGAPAGLVRDDRPEARHLDVAATAAAVADLLTATAAEAGLMIIVDDLHDATADTIDVLSRTLSNLSGPILVLLFGRPELVRVAGALTRLADAEVLALAPLRGADAARLLGAYLGGGRLPQVDEDRLLATAQGNPFYLAELVAMLLERGALTRTDGSAQAPPASATGWRLAAGSLGGRLLSRDLAAVLAARIDALPVEARLALRDAAVVGDSVPAAALDTLHQRRTAPAGTTPGGLTPVRPGQASTEVDPAVDELLGRRMLRRAPAGYAFATPLLREAAYAGIGKADLAERHAHLAAWAAADGHRSDGGTVMASPERDVFIAEHAERAANLANAVGLRDDALARAAVPVGVAALGRAARRAVGLGEPQVAIGYAQRARALGGGDLPIADQLVLAKALLELGRVTEALGYAERISASDDLTSRAGALLVAGRAYRLLGDRDRGYHAWEDALIAAQATGSPAGQAEAMRRLGMADFLGGRLAEAGFRFTEAYQVAVAAGDRKSQAWSLQNLAWVTTTRGDFAGADAALARATRIFAELADPVGRAWLRGTTAFARLLAGRLAEARRLAQLFLPFGERVGEQWAVGTLGAVQAYAAAELGDLMQADRLARRAYRDFAIASDDWGRGFALLARGAIARGLGEFAHAQDLLTDALGYGVSTGHPLLVGVGHTQRGFAALDQGDTAAAKADARAALAGELLPDRIEPAQVGPQALLAAALLHEGDASASVGLLEPVAADPAGPCLLFARRYALATYAAALRETGELDRAVVIAQLATQLRGEDVRSAAVALREYATCRHAIGDRDGAAQTIALALATTHAGNQPVELARTEQLAATLR